MDVLAVQAKVAECDWTPVPVRGMIAGELVASLAMVTLAPGTLPIAAGAKVTFRVAFCPGGMTCPVDTPLALKPAPEMLTFEMVTLALPELVSVRERML